MATIRFLAAIAMAMLLCGAACTPVYSDRPLGSAPFTNRWGEAYSLPSDINGVWVLESSGDMLGTAFVAAFDPEIGRYRVGRWKNSLDSLEFLDGEPTEVEIRSHVVAGKYWLFFNEEDRQLKGSFLWALARQHNDDTFLVWYPYDRFASFRGMVEDKRLPGQVVDGRVGDSGIVTSPKQSLILQGLDDRHLTFIVEHHGELFEQAEPRLLTRIRRLPPFKADDLKAFRPAASAASSAGP